MTFYDSDDLSWLAELPMLLSRRSDLGIGADVNTMCLDELRGVHRFLTRVDEKVNAKRFDKD